MVVSLFVRRYAPFRVFTGGFSGDDRDAASTAATASSKTIAEVQFDSSGVIGHRGTTSGTKYIGLGTHVRDWIGTHHADVEVTVTNIVRTPDGGTLSFTVFSSGANPLTPGAPPIRTWIDFTAVFGEGGNTYKGTARGSPFPNAEVFVVESPARNILLLDYQTTGTSVFGPLKLFGDYESHVLGTFSTIFVKIGPNARCPVTVET